MLRPLPVKVKIKSSTVIITSPLLNDTSTAMKEATLTIKRKHIIENCHLTLKILLYMLYVGGLYFIFNSTEYIAGDTLPITDVRDNNS